MSSSYPASLDSFATNHADNVGEVIEAADVNDLADATNKIEAELGTEPSGTFATVKARLATLVRALAQGNTRLSHTGSTSETTLATVTIPAGTIGANGRLRITFFTHRNSGGTSDVRLIVKWSGAAGTQIGFYAMTTAQQGMRGQLEIINRNSETAQLCGLVSANQGWGVTSAAPTTTTVDTTAETTIALRASLANSADTLHLDSYLVEHVPGV